MSFRAAAISLDVPNLTATERLVLIYYADHCDEQGKCFPSQGSIARRSGLSRATVSRATKALATKGRLRIKVKYRKDGSQRAKLIFICVARPGRWAKAFNGKGAAE